jgi:hypothetical protein
VPLMPRTGCNETVPHHNSFAVLKVPLWCTPLFVFVDTPDSL